MPLRLDNLSSRPDRCARRRFRSTRGRGRIEIVPLVGIDFFLANSQLNVDAGEVDVRPPLAPTTQQRSSTVTVDDVEGGHDCRPSAHDFRAGVSSGFKSGARNTLHLEFAWAAAEKGMLRFPRVLLQPLDISPYL